MSYRGSRDIPPEDRYGGGQSYRPGNVRERSPIRRDRDADMYSTRSPPRRPYDARGPPRRSRSPPGRDNFRRRSPSPQDRWGPPRGADTYRAPPRSPPRRDIGREDLIRREDRRDARDFRDNRSPRDRRAFADRSPLPQSRDRSPLGNGRGPAYRGRAYSPGARRDRTPPRRFVEPPSHPRSRSPSRRVLSPRRQVRGALSRPPSPIGNARNGPPSPRLRKNHEPDDRGRDSGATSRRSSPPVHASRLALLPDLDVGPQSNNPSPRGNNAVIHQYTRLLDARRALSPAKDHENATVVADRARSPPRPKDPPLGPSAERVAPSGSVPAGPSASRAFGAPPSGPRGDNMATRGGFAPRGRGGFNEYQGRTSITATFRTPRVGGTNGSAASTSEREGPAIKPPAAQPSTETQIRPPAVRTASATMHHRYDGFSAPREPRSAAPGPDSHRRPATGTIPAGPAGDRSRETREPGVHPALRDLPEIIPGGKKLPPITDQSRMQKFEEDAERLRKVVQERDIKKRKSLREWDRLVREGDSAAYRSELAEASIRAFDGEGERAGAAF